MRDTMTASTEQWMQFYDQQPPQPVEAFPDATLKDGLVHETFTKWDMGRVDIRSLIPTSGEIVSDATVKHSSAHEALTKWDLEKVNIRSLIPPSQEVVSNVNVMTNNLTPTIPSETMILSPTSSYTRNIGHLTPKGNVSKPIRRRSRASKRTPTTLLNANTTNFRALVQQFTGCPRATLSSSSSLGVHKGPITLNFQQGSKQVQHETSTRIMPQINSRSYNQVHQVHPQFPWQKEKHQLPQQQQQLLQEKQQSGYSFDYVKNSNFVLNSGNSSRPSTGNMEVSDGLLMDNDFGLHYLTVNAFSNDTFQE